MSKVIWALFGLVGFVGSVYPHDTDLEKRVEVLERKLEALTGKSAGTSGLKVKDAEDKVLQREVSSQGRGVSLPKKKRQEVLRQLEQYKKRKKAQEKLLEQLMNEDT